MSFVRRQDYVQAVLLIEQSSHVCLLCQAYAEAACCLQADHGRVTVGLTGYPNVGKSSTINALFGSKKTAVAPTPGKTKHFQTLNITDGLTLCDCPGLVLPRYAQSKSEMVAAGIHCTSR